MNNKEYQDFCVSLERTDNDIVMGRLDVKTLRLIHGSVGMCTETGEIQDAIKKHLWYGKPLDDINLLEEAGDTLWYISILLDALGYTIDDAKNANVAKLKQRYEKGFTETQAKNRNLDKERTVLETSGAKNGE